MNWLDKLNAKQRAEVKTLQDTRAEAVQLFADGRLSVQIAQGIVEHCNEKIAKIAEVTASC